MSTDRRAATPAYNLTEESVSLVLDNSELVDLLDLLADADNEDPQITEQPCLKTQRKVRIASPKLVIPVNLCGCLCNLSGRLIMLCTSAALSSKYLKAWREHSELDGDGCTWSVDDKEAAKDFRSAKAKLFGLAVKSTGSLKLLLKILCVNQAEFFVLWHAKPSFRSRNTRQFCSRTARPD
eukprot:1268265-Pleurochrysis_carterae.AAC.2